MHVTLHEIMTMMYGCFVSVVVNIDFNTIGQYVL